MPEGPLLEAAALEWWAAGHRILGPLDLAVDHGECVAVVGPNGAGKTTLLRLVAGLRKPSAGSLVFEGRPLASFSRRELARRVAYVPQLRPNRIPLSVRQMVLLGRYPHWRRGSLGPADEDFRAVADALERVGLERLAERPLDELSGGERQGVFLAACLVQEADLLVLDEPTTHLDPRHQQDVAALILDLARESERTVLCATHDLNFASLIADRLLGLRGGRIVTAGAPAEVLEATQLRLLFEASFEIVPRGRRPLTVLHLERE